MGDDKPEPRRKVPNRAKSSDGTSTGSRPTMPDRRKAPPNRSMSFDGSGGGMQSMRNLMTKANSVSGKSMRALMVTANSAKNVVTSGAEQAVKVHTMLATKAPKPRTGGVYVKSLSQKDIQAGLRNRSPLGRALSVERLQIPKRDRSKSPIPISPTRGRSTRGLGDNNNDDGGSTHRQRRGGRRPDRSLTPSSSLHDKRNQRKGRSTTPSNRYNGRKDRVIVGKNDDDDDGGLAIM